MRQRFLEGFLEGEGGVIEGAKKAEARPFVEYDPLRVHPNININTFFRWLPGWGGSPDRVARGLPTGGQGSKVYVLFAEPKEHQHLGSGARPGGSVTGVTEKLFMCQMFMCLFQPLNLYGSMPPICSAVPSFLVSLSGTESAILNRESSDSESCDSNRAIPRSLETLTCCDSDGDSESIFRDSTLLRFHSFFCFSLRNFWRFQARDSGNRAIRDSRFCAAKL